MFFFLHEWQALKQQSLRYKTEKTYSTDEGEQDSNIRKNRYKDILPCEYMPTRKFLWTKTLTEVGDEPVYHDKFSWKQICFKE